MERSWSEPIELFETINICACDGIDLIDEIDLICCDEQLTPRRFSFNWNQIGNRIKDQWKWEWNYR